MSTSLIKNAALRPSRWGEPFSSGRTQWPYDRNPWGDTVLTNGIRCKEIVGLVPGGRFLVTRSFDIATIALWDLGLPGIADVSPPNVVAEYYTAEGPFDRNASSQATLCAASGTTLRIVTILGIGHTEYL